MTNAVCVWDFTVGKSFTDLESLKLDIKENCKKWCFQLEESDSGYIHYQGRISLKVKKRLPQVKSVFKCKEIHWSVTSSENSKNTFYVTKPETRIDGPWSDQDKEIYIPRQFRGKLESLRPFQQVIWDSANEFEDRCINCIINSKGNVGKSMIASLCDLYGRGIDIPPINDSEKLIQSVCNRLMAKSCRTPGLVFVDIPRATKQEKLSGMFSAIEQIKKGKVYDMRYHFTEWWFDSPQIWVFMNIVPKSKYLSRDRWRFFDINDDYELIKYEEHIENVKSIKDIYDLY